MYFDSQNILKNYNDRANLSVSISKLSQFYTKLEEKMHVREAQKQQLQAKQQVNLLPMQDIFPLFNFISKINSLMSTNVLMFPSKTECSDFLFL